MIKECRSNPPLRCLSGSETCACTMHIHPWQRNPLLVNACRVFVLSFLLCKHFLACALPIDNLRMQMCISELAPLKKLKVADLRALCGSCYVVSTGVKDVLIQRLDSLRKERSSPVKASPSAAVPWLFVSSASRQQKERRVTIRLFRKATCITHSG